MLASLARAPNGGLSAIGAAARIARASYASSAAADAGSPGAGVVEITSDADFASVVDKLGGERVCVRASNRARC